jgi:hypothetical protein
VNALHCLAYNLGLTSPGVSVPPHLGTFSEGAVGIFLKDCLREAAADVFFLIAANVFFLIAAKVSFIIAPNIFFLIAANVFFLIAAKVSFIIAPNVFFLIAVNVFFYDGKNKNLETLSPGLKILGSIVPRSPLGKR